MSPDLKTKIQVLFNGLNQGLVERESILKIALLTVLAGENLLLIGPPGTAKSLIARRIAQTLTTDDNSHRYFEYLLTKFSTPEEIFGPLSIAALKADCVKRNTAGYLPTVRIAFLDEIFKASSSILNALLTILNERIYHNGAELQRVPMQALIAASNELPTGQEELGALYDRFLVRVFVDYVSLDSLPQLFEKTLEQASVTPFTADELKAIQQAADKVSIPPEIVQAIQQIWQKHRETFKEDRREQLSDRRLKKVIKLLSVAAATNGRTAVDLSDVFLLKDCLWNHPDNALKVRDMIMAVLRDCSYPIVSASDNRGDIDAFLQGHSISIQEDDPYAAFEASRLKNNKFGNAKFVIKGYKGSGTQIDPVLISTYQDIAGLERTEVGQQGYYFKQTADIDCSVLSTWPEITFQGHYDGGGYSIIYTQQQQTLGQLIQQRQQQQSQVKHLFSNIKQHSSVINLRLKTMLLAINADDSDISACTVVDYSLLDSANNCRITACDSSKYLITQNAKQCEITRCQSGDALIGNIATACTITDCFSVLVSNSNAATIQW